MPIDALHTSAQHPVGSSPPRSNEFLIAAQRLHRHLEQQHWDGQALVGPDPIGKINWRVTRFLRGYLSFLPWRDRYTFLQAQGYWIKSNVQLHKLTGEDGYLKFVRAAAENLAITQGAEGAWYYTLPERRHLVGVPEGMWAGLGLLAAYQQFGQQELLDAARRWYRFHNEQMGFVEYRDTHVPNYYNKPGGIVPNVACLTLRFCTELAQVAGDSTYLENVDRMVRFLPHGQMRHGEIEYVFASRPHFQCFQYNAYEFLDLTYCLARTGDERLRPILSKLAVYLATGVTAQGSCRYDCFKQTPEVNYWIAALAMALRKAHELKLGDYHELSERAYRYLLSKQREDGGFDFSVRNYRLLRDTRSYPRTLAMILNHLLFRAELPGVVSPVQCLDA